MNGWFIEIARQVPSLLVMAFIVVKFLESNKERGQVLKDISDQCHDVQRRSMETIQENTKILAGLAEIVRDCRKR